MVDGKGYLCIVCNKMLYPVDGVYTHDDVPHPENKIYSKEESYNE